MLKAISLKTPLIIKCLAHYDFFLTPSSTDLQKELATTFSSRFFVGGRFLFYCLFVIGLIPGVSQL